jgi:Ca2+-binding EF-hand superfamily protein
MSNLKDKLMEAFKEIDSNRDGMIQKEELDKILIEFGLSRKEADDLFKLVDVNSDGKISVEEFLVGFMVVQ